MASFRELENNLKAFLVDVQSDAHNIKTMAASRYNNIKISMNPAKLHQRHVNIKMGISEATFDLISFEKIGGGLGFEERFIHRWFERSGIKTKLDECWDNEAAKSG